MTLRTDLLMEHIIGSQLPSGEPLPRGENRHGEVVFGRLDRPCTRCAGSGLRDDRGACGGCQGSGKAYGPKWLVEQ